MIAPAPSHGTDNAGGGVWRYRTGNIILSLGMMTWIGAFMPEPIVLCTVPGIVLWLMLIERCRTTRSAIGWTFLFGAVGIGYGYRWMSQTIQDFGNQAAPAAWVATAAFGAAGILHGLIFIMVHRAMLKRGRRPHPLVSVLLMVGCEHLPMRLFPWKVGHGAVDTAPLLQAAEWGGVSAVSFVLLCLAIPVHEWIRWAWARAGPPARPKAALVTFGVGCALFAIGLIRYGDLRSDEDEAADSIRIGIVQPNVGHKDKRAAERALGAERLASLKAYERGSREVAAQGAELIVWPETAITNSVPILEPKHDPHLTNGFLNRRQVGYRFLTGLGEKHAFLVGAYERIPGRQKITGKPFDERYNVAALREVGGLTARWTVYRKVYLIPFGEFIPKPFSYVMDPEDYLPQNFTMRPGSMGGEAAKHSSMLAYENTRLGRTLKLAPFLCYEGILPEHVRQVTGGERPDLLVSLTNDSWFGDTWEPHQHLNFTRFRAVEHRVPMIRSTNTGISAFVSITGDVRAKDRLGVHTEGVLVRDVKLIERGPTIYVRFGHWFPWIALGIALLAVFSALMRPPPIKT